MSRGRRISRIKLEHPTPEAAARYLREWHPAELHARPEGFPAMTAPDLFGRECPLTLEIGCGTGELLNASALESPERCFLGVEVSRRAVYHGVNRAADLQVPNVLYIRADFQLLYPLIALVSLDQVWMIFPDPNYGGSRKRRNRIFSPTFLDHMAGAVKPGGLIKVVTDQQTYLEEMLKISRADQRYRFNHRTEYLTDFPAPVKTRFQSAWEQYDRPVFRFELIRL